MLKSFYSIVSFIVGRDVSSEADGPVKTVVVFAYSKGSERFLGGGFVAVGVCGKDVFDCRFRVIARSLISDGLFEQPNSPNDRIRHAIKMPTRRVLVMVSPFLVLVAKDM